MSFSSRFASAFVSGGRESWFAEVMRRAQEREASADEPLIVPGDEHGEDPQASPFFDELQDPHELLTGEQLLFVLRAPVEWLLELAERLAGSDPDDGAAVRRVREAFIARVAGRAMRVRITDLLVVFGILVGALDLDVVAQALRQTLGDGIVTLVAAQQAQLAAQLVALATRVSHAPAPRRPHRRPQRTPRTR